MSLQAKTKHAIKRMMRHVLGAYLYEMGMGTWHLGYVPHIRHPRSFNEKLMHRKIYQWQNLPSHLANKWAVREHVAKIIGEEYLNEVYGVFDRAEDIDFSKLPDQFVIKGTHGSNMTIMVRDRQNFDEAEVRKKCRKILADRYGFLSNEPWYLAIPPKLIIEKYITDDPFVRPVDYRFFVFGGQVQFVEIDINRFTPVCTRNIVDRNFSRFPFHQNYPENPNLAKPVLWNKMIKLAEQLGAGWDALRIDFYSPKQESILFGEITFTHTAGWTRFTPREADFELGKLWNMS